MTHLITIPHIKGNATPVITDILQNLPAGKPVIIRFEKGIYTFDAEGTFKRTIKTEYLKKDPKKIIFLLENLENVTIDGNGSEFIFTDRLFPFALLQCQNVTLENFTIDFSFCRYCQGTVLSSDEKGFELAVDRNDFKYHLNEKGNLVFSSGNDSFSTADLPVLLGNSVMGKPPWDYIFTGEDHQNKTGLATTYVETDATETAAGLYFAYRPGSRRLKLTLQDTLLFNYEPRANINIFMFESCGITIRNIRMFRSGGMGVVGTLSSDILIDGLFVQVRPGRKDCFSLTADAMFFSNCSGSVTVRNSTVEKTIDDALNIHGYYTVISEICDDRSVVLRDGLKSHNNLCPGNIGNLLQFHSAKTHNCLGEAVIEQIVFQEDGSYRVTLDRAITGVSCGDLVENDSLAADFTFENNRIFQCPQVRVSDNGKLRIRNNCFEESIALLIDDLFEYWHECGVVKDLVIENNTFINTPRAGGENGAVQIISTRIPTSSVRHRNIRISENKFINLESTPVQIRVENADNVNISGNIFSCGNINKLITAKLCNNLIINNNNIK